MSLDILVPIPLATYPGVGLLEHMLILAFNILSN